VEGSTVTVTPSSSTALVGQPHFTDGQCKKRRAIGVDGQTLRFTIPTGNGTLSGGLSVLYTTSQTVTTTSSGTSSAVTFTPAVEGIVVVTVDWLNAAGNVTQSASTTISAATLGLPFKVTSPTTNPTSLLLGSSQAINVSGRTAFLARR